MRSATRGFLMRRFGPAGMIGARLAGGLAGAGLVPPLLAAPAFAQSTNQTTQRTAPTREEITPPTPTPAPKGTVSVDSRAAIAQPSCPFDSSPLRIKLDRVVFTRPDGSALPPEIVETLQAVDPALGDQPIRVVCNVRDAANDALRRAGWVASVQIPPQSLAPGELTLHIITARITEIRVRGNPGSFRRILERRIEALKRLDPLNQHDAERLLLLAGDLPGVDIQLSLRPAGTKPGDVIGDLNVSHRRFALLGNVQNYNSVALGRESAYVRGEVYGLTGLADITYVGASTTRDFKAQNIAQVGHILGLDGSGTTLGARFTYAWSRPDLGALSLKTNTLIAGFDVVQPLIRSVRQNLRIAAGFDYVNQDTRVNSGATDVPLNLDKLRIGYVRMSGELQRRRLDGSVALSVRGGIELRKGFGIFDATPRTPNFLTGALPSRVDGNSRAFVARGDLDAVAGFGPYFSFAGSLRAQWADSPLLNYEEFSLGNLTIGRGYDPGSNSGDRAIGLRGEPRLSLPVSTRFETQAFSFYDYVALTNLDLNSTEVDRHIASYGGGVRIIVPNRLILEGIYAHPRNRALTIDKGAPTDRFLLSLIVQFRGPSH